jgi:mannose-6-phosphate isomerase-like protein (cupin superfamily)
MRKLVAGRGADGRSSAVVDEDITGADATLWQGREVPPRLVSFGGAGEERDLGVRPGKALWVVHHFRPGEDVPMHHTASIDLDVLLAGSLTLVLDDGEHPLAPGDCVVVDGVDHAWRPGPNGATLAALVIGATT